MYEQMLAHCPEKLQCFFQQVSSDCDRIMALISYGSHLQIECPEAVAPYNACLAFLGYSGNESIQEIVDSNPSPHAIDQAESAIARLLNNIWSRGQHPLYEKMRQRVHEELRPAFVGVRTDAQRVRALITYATYVALQYPGAAGKPA